MAQGQPRPPGEDLLIVASQLAGFDKTKDRPDLLALDRAGKLVVIEIKRDDSGSGQDLQALRNAAYVSTLEAEQIVGSYTRMLWTGLEEEGGVPSRLIKTDAGEGRQEGTPWKMFAGSPAVGRATRSRSRLMSSRARGRAG